VGSHEHFFWGFTSTGIYCLTFQSVGTRVGEAIPTASVATTFVFHVLPLPNPTNFLTWQKTQWPPWIPASVTAPAADPDGDKIANIFEYAFYLDPMRSNNAAALPALSFVTNANQKLGALSFTRYKLAADLTYRVEATSALPGGWTPITNVFATVPGASNLTERVTVRDSLPANTDVPRFYRLKVSLN
jgi:surface-anchored protein